jgi:hypothetical protein
MIPPQPRDCADAVEQRHVEVDHHRVRVERLGELDRREAVGGGAGDGQVRLTVDQQAQRFEEPLVVVCEQHSNVGRSQGG